MSGAVFDWGAPAGAPLALFLRMWGAALGTGLAVKLMDDTLDRQLDRLQGLRNFGDRLGRSATPYALLFLCLGMYWHARLGLGLFLAAYATGMASRPRERLPLGLQAWQETLLATALLFALAGWRQALQALLLLIAVQIADDWRDRDEQMPAGPRAWVTRAGLPVTVLLGGGALLGAAALGPSTAAAVALAAACVWPLTRKRRWWPC